MTITHHFEIDNIVTSPAMGSLTYTKQVNANDPEIVTYYSRWRLRLSGEDGDFDGGGSLYLYNHYVLTRFISNSFVNISSPIDMLPIGVAYYILGVSSYYEYINVMITDENNVYIVNSTDYGKTWIEYKLIYTGNSVDINYNTESYTHGTTGDPAQYAKFDSFEGTITLKTTDDWDTTTSEADPSPTELYDITYTGYYGEVFLDNVDTNKPIQKYASDYISIFDVDDATYVAPLLTDRSAYNAYDFPELHTNDSDTWQSIHHHIGTGKYNVASGDHAHITNLNLDDLGDVNTAGAGSGNFLMYDSSINTWIPGSGVVLESYFQAWVLSRGLGA